MKGMTIYSQNNEQEILFKLFDVLKPEGNRVFVDIGAWNSNVKYQHSNTYALSLYKGWIPYRYDRDGAKNPEEVQELDANLHTLERVYSDIKGHENIHLLSVDIDGNDYWIVRDFLKNIQPWVVVVEYNNNLDFDSVVTIPYNYKHNFEQDDYYGCSGGAWINLLGETYELFTITPNNMVFVRSDKMPKKMPKEVADLRNLEHPKKKRTWKERKGAAWFPILEYNMAFNGDKFAEVDFAELITRSGAKLIIETGTNKGHTTYYFSSLVPNVYTIESETKFFEIARKMIGGFENIRPIKGKSEEHLGLLLSGVASKGDVPVVFFLDAHWYSVNPLLMELDIIAKSGKNIVPFIVIHDFKNPNHPEYGYDKFNGKDYTFDLIKENVDKIYKSRGMKYDYYFNDKAAGAKRGIIYIQPKLK